MAVWSHVGEMICKAIEQKNIDYVVMGRRGLGTFERMILGSTSKYVIENAKCNVIVAKIDISKKHKIEEESTKREENFHSTLNHNITILAEGLNPFFFLFFLLILFIQIRRRKVKKNSRRKKS